MNGTKKPPDETNQALLAFANDYEPTLEEARAELEESGVDVEAFLARFRERLSAQQEAGRLSWRAGARRRIEARSARARPPRDYSGLSREAKIERLEKLESKGRRVGGYHKLEELPDEDLVTLLQDLEDDSDPDAET